MPDGVKLNETELVVDSVPLEVADAEPAVVPEAATVAIAVVLFDTDDVGDAAALLDAVTEEVLL